MSFAVKPRKIGGTEVFPIGYGAMGISAYYTRAKPLTDEERFAVLDTAYESGCNHWDTADVYGDSEELLGNWFKRTNKRSEIFLASKCGIVQGIGVDGSPKHVKEAIESSLKKLGVDYIDLYYLHRPDTKTPIEHTIGALAEFVKKGKIRHIGLSECSASTLRRAHAVHPIAALQVEYSPFTLDIEFPEVNLLKTARELGVTIVAYSPLGRGLLTGQYKSPDDFEEDDFRRTIPRYSKENFPNILSLVSSIQKIGDKYGASSGQVALAWLLAQGEDVVAIPGTTRIKALKENIDAANVKLSPEDVAEVRRLAENAEAGKHGDRYPPGMREQLFADTPPLQS
ncbi:Aldo/keto reductase [Fomitiporia mediterranea MF3/22]|uniref:Aldo/keto reductase n=1 Tax=Fomitiporia mediterranea (strain MF3/22) TaxID=694068 RepID=UPI000440968F|nr:Aldo/keto reductase [Fomitiporia mediterranea MF3/22]EJD05613.1 Aldo/keto reductase [Fomitiporia mediterranea MF3/22]